jgi:hypothetical protein
MWAFNDDALLGANRLASNRSRAALDAVLR